MTRLSRVVAFLAFLTCQEQLNCSASQLQGVIQRFLLETGALTEPDAIEPVLSASSPLLMVDKLGDRTEQAPSSPTGRYQFSTPAMALLKR